MKNITACLLIAWGILTATAWSQSPVPDVFAQNRKLGRSVNILGYDPIWRSRDQARFKLKYFRELREAGFNSVRINLHGFRQMNATNGWALRDSWFEVLDWALTGAREQGLIAILDLHEYNAMGEAAEANREKFLAFWRQVAARYQDAPAGVYFEILNEPSKQMTPARWNDYLRQALAIIREKNPTRPVIVGPAFWNSIEHLGELELPESDRNLIVTVHYYQPMEFTHQGAAWTNQKEQLGVDWAGNAEDLARLKRDFDKVGAWAQAHQRPIFLGEFGAYDKAEMAARARYIGAVARAAEQHDWSWAYWQFDSDFILYDVKQDVWVKPLLNALIPGANARP